MKELCKHILETLDQNDIYMISSIKDGNYYLREMRFCSPADEDFVFNIWFDGTAEDFVRKFAEYAEDFDPDEHAEMWIPYRGKGGCPLTIRELIEDADEIKAFLIDVADTLNRF